MVFFLNTNVFIEYPLLKRYFGKLAIGQSINFTSSHFISLSISP